MVSSLLSSRSLYVFCVSSVLIRSLGSHKLVWELFSLLMTEGSSLGSFFLYSGPFFLRLSGGGGLLDLHDHIGFPRLLLP